MKNSLYIVCLLTIISCQEKKPLSDDYLQTLNNWKSDRLKYLKSETGYVNLAGLFWLNEGPNSFGAATNNDLEFPADKSADFMGVIVQEADSVFIVPAIDVRILTNDQLVKARMLAYHDSLEDVPEFSHGSLRWTVIKRGQQFGVRLRDLEHPNLTGMKPIDYYPVNTDYVVTADFLPYDPPKMVKTTNILGMVYHAPVPGVLTFQIGGRQYQVEPNVDGDKLHLRFTDKTTGEETYGLGRYLHIDMPKGEQEVVIDFNRAYNPPCAFTEFATCPIPPKQNHLALRMEVGEMNYH